MNTSKCCSNISKHSKAKNHQVFLLSLVVSNRLLKAASSAPLVDLDACHRQDREKSGKLAPVFFWNMYDIVARNERQLREIV
jgi:hypothetical protein